MCEYKYVQCDFDSLRLALHGHLTLLLQCVPLSRRLCPEVVRYGQTLCSM